MILNKKEKEMVNSLIENTIYANRVKIIYKKYGIKRMSEHLNISVHDARELTDVKDFSKISPQLKGLISKTFKKIK